MYLFVYVPVAGHIAPASARNRIGPLSMRQLAKEVQFEPAAVTGSVADPPFSAIPPRSHWKMLVPPGGTNSSVGGTNSSANGIKRKYPHINH